MTLKTKDYRSWNGEKFKKLRDLHLQDKLMVLYVENV